MPFFGTIVPYTKTPAIVMIAGIAVIYGAGEETRTPDLRITNALLYQLSYTSACERAGLPPSFFVP